MAFDLRMFDKRKLILGAAAIAAGLIAMVLSNNYIQQQAKEQAARLGGAMSDKEVKKLMQRIQALEDENKKIAGSMQQAIQQAAQQAQVRPAQKQPPALAVNIPVGHRAVTVMIDTLSAVGGMISPGDYVDIIAHLAIPTDPKDPKKAETVSVTLFQNILVLAVAGSTAPGTPHEIQQKASSLPLTFALTPHEAGLISFAQQHGRLQLVLRSPLDNQAFILPPANWDSLGQYILATQGMDLGVSGEELPPEVQPEEKPYIEIYRGGSK